MAPDHKVYDRPRVLKLGVKAGQRVLALDLPDDGFAGEAREMGAEVEERATPPEATEAYDLIFLALRHRDELGAIAAARPALRRDGALWTIRPKGAAAVDVTELEVMHAGQAAGLVDVKVVAFSATHSALKFVYRLRDR